MKRGRVIRACVFFRSSVNHDVISCSSTQILECAQHFDRVVGAMQVGGTESGYSWQTRAEKFLLKDILRSLGAFALGDASTRRILSAALFIDLLAAIDSFRDIRLLSRFRSGGRKVSVGSWKVHQLSANRISLTRQKRLRSSNIERWCGN